MGAVLSNLLGEERHTQPELPQLSTLCGACKDICPVKIDIPRMLIELRSDGAKPTWQKGQPISEMKHNGSCNWASIMNRSASPKR
jgi:L-lactate utilization protein LutB